MKHIAAYLLLSLGGNTSPSAADIKSLLAAGGVEADESRLEKLISELEGKDINEVSFILLGGGILIVPNLRERHKELTFGYSSLPDRFFFFLFLFFSSHTSAHR